MASVYNDRYLFLHIPKTAGKVIERVLRAATDPPLNDAFTGYFEIDFGRPHVPLRHMAWVAGRPLSNWEKIFTVVRDPFDLQRSQFDHWRNAMDEYTRNSNRLAPHPAASVTDISEFVLGWPDIFQEPYEDFICKQGIISHAGWREGGLDRYWLEDENGRLPPNLEVLQFEKLSEQLPPLLESIGGKPPDLTHIQPHVPPVDHVSRFSDEAQRKVKEMYRWSILEFYRDYLPVDRVDERWDETVRPVASLRGDAKREHTAWFSDRHRLSRDGKIIHLPLSHNATTQHCTDCVHWSGEQIGDTTIKKCRGPQSVWGCDVHGRAIFGRSGNGIMGSRDCTDFELIPKNEGDA